MLEDTETCKNTYVQHFGATCTQKHSSGSTFEPPALKSTAQAALLEPPGTQKSSSSSTSELLKHAKTRMFSTSESPALKRALTYHSLGVMTCLSFLRSHSAASNCAFESIVLSSDLLIFPSESLRCFELCFRIDCAQY